MQFEKRYSFVLEFRNVAPESIRLALETEDAEFCLSRSEGGFRIEDGEEGFRLEGFSWQKDGLTLKPDRKKNSFSMRMGLAVAESVETLVFELSELEEGVVFLDLGGVVKKSCGGTIEIPLCQ